VTRFSYELKIDSSNELTLFSTNLKNLSSFCFRLIWPNIRFISAIDKYIRYRLNLIPVMTKIGVSKSSVASL